MTVEMKLIPDFDGYRAGSDGNIYSYWVHGGRNAHYDLNISPKRISPVIHPKRGYRQCRIKSSFGKLVSCYIHSLVATAFHGRRPPGMECSHLDGDTANNRPDNLRWETPEENNSRKYHHGTSQIMRSRILTDKQIGQIKKMIASKKHSQDAIAAKFGVTQSTISRINIGAVIHGKF